jgi:hypothetical protein
MTISVVHSFVSAKSQGADATEVSKNEWNAEHTYTMATGMLLGRTTASTGTVEEITPNSTDFTFSSTALALAAPDVFRVLTADATGSDVNTAQSVFVTTEDFTGAASTTYAFDAFYHITRAAGTTSHTTAVLLGGTATYTSVRYLAQVTNPTGNALAAVNQIVGDAATAVTLTAANTSATENLTISLKGIIRVNGSGTIIPQFQFSAAPGGAPTIKANSYFRLRKLGTDTVASAGSWA